MNKMLMANIIALINDHEKEIRSFDTFQGRLNAVIDILDVAYPRTSFYKGMNDTVSMMNFTNRMEVERLMEPLKRMKNEGITYHTNIPSLNEIISIIISKFKD